jgi:hypothetical protein
MDSAFMKCPLITTSGLLHLNSHEEKFMTPFNNGNMTVIKKWRFYRYKRHFLYQAFAILSAFYCSNAYRAEPEAFSSRQEAPPSPPPLAAANSNIDY